MGRFGLAACALTLAAAVSNAQTPTAPATAPAQAEDDGSRIVGGFRAPEGSAPWQVAMFSTTTYSDQEIAEDRALPMTDPNKKFLHEKGAWGRTYRCGGALIRPDWVLTAAHCVVKVQGDPLQMRRLRLGTQDLEHGGADYAIDRIVVHKDYSSKTKKHDIALIRISDSAAMPGTARPILLLGDRPADRPLASSQRVSVTGWGRTGVRDAGSGGLARDGSVNLGSPVLMQVDLKIVSQAECEAVPAYAGFLGAGVICAGSSVPGKDSCNGDSGGPLTRAQGPEQGPAGRRLVGLVSWGAGCGVAGVPGIYTDVAFYRQWIDNAIATAPAGTLTRM